MVYLDSYYLVHSGVVYLCYGVYSVANSGIWCGCALCRWHSHSLLCHTLGLIQSIITYASLLEEYVILYPNYSAVQMASRHHPIRKVKAVVVKLPRPARVQACSTCEHPTEKVGGCNHILCPLCKAKWCWLDRLLKESKEGQPVCTNRKHRSH